MAEFTKQRESLMRISDELTALSVTVRSKDRAVEVTVGSQGQPTGLRFLNNKHQSMSGQQLATSVLEAMAGARQEVADQVAARFASVSAGGLGIAGSGLENLDMDRLFEPLSAEGLLPKGVGGDEGGPAAARGDGGTRRA